MKQFVLPVEYDGTGTIVIKNEDFHYLVRVARRQAGDSFHGRDSHGLPVNITIKSISKNSCVLSVEMLTESADLNPVDNPRIVLFQCVPKGQKMDLIIRQATETGIYGVVPVESQHCIPRGAARDNTKHERRLRIARQAMQQSGSPVAPEINNTIPFSGFPSIWEHLMAGIHEDEVVGLFFHQEPIGDMSLGKILSGHPKLIGMFIGPEGGFSGKEVTTLLQSSFQPVYIRTNVLRTETAALYAIAAVQTLLNMPE